MTPMEVQSRANAIIRLAKEGSSSAKTIDDLGIILLTDIIKAIANGANCPQELAKVYIEMYGFPLVEWLRS